MNSRRFALLAVVIGISGAFLVYGFAPATEKKWRFETDPYVAAKNGDLKSIKIHLEKNPKLIKKFDSRGLTLLHYAAYGNHPELIRYLVKKGANLEIHGNPMEQGSGERPLHSAASSPQGGFEAAKLLIDLGADPKATVATGFENLKAPNKEFKELYKNMKGPNALDFAALNGNAKVVGLLLKKGVSPFRPPKRHGLYVTTSLHWACTGARANRGNRKVIKLLVPAVKDVNIKNGLGQTPLHKAAEYLRADTVAFLLETYPKIDINAKGPKNNTALHMAIHMPHVKASSKKRGAVVQILLKYKPDLTIRNFDGQTALDRAVATGDDHLIKLLQ